MGINKNINIINRIDAAIIIKTIGVVQKGKRCNDIVLFYISLI